MEVPGLSGNVEKDIKNLSNYVFQLSEQLRYALYNLDVTNFNDLGLARYENGRLQIYSEKLQASVKELELKISGAEDSLTATIEGKAGELTTTISEKLDGVDVKMSQWQQTVSGFSTTVSQKINDVDTKVSTWQQTVDGFSTQISERFTSLEGTYVKTSVYNLTAGKISAIVEEIGANGTVTAASIVAAINNSSSRVEISADHIDLSGVATFSAISEEDDYTLIDGAYIRCGSGYQAVEIFEGTIYLGEAELYNDSYGITLLHTHGGTFYVTSPNGTFWALTDNGWEEQ